VLFAALGQARAWERLHDPEVIGAYGMRSDNILSLAKAAGHTEAESQKIASDWAWQRSKHDLPF
jgi:hypothetical protein